MKQTRLSCYVPIKRGDRFAVGLAILGEGTTDLLGPDFATAHEAKAASRRLNHRRRLRRALLKVAGSAALFLALMSAALWMVETYVPGQQPITRMLNRTIP